MVANQFAVLGNGKKRYNAISGFNAAYFTRLSSVFPPRTDPAAGGTSSDGDLIGIGEYVALTGTQYLTKSWRVVEASSESNAYLTVQYYDAPSETWTTVHSFNSPA